MQISQQEKSLKLANLAMCCEVGKAVAKLAMVLRSWQWYCEVGNGVAKLAMRNFAKVLKFYVRSEFRKCTVHVASEFRNAN